MMCLNGVVLRMSSALKTKTPVVSGFEMLSRSGCLISDQLWCSAGMQVRLLAYREVKALLDAGELSHEGNKS